MAPRLVLVLGGVRSGKSAFAQRLAARLEDQNSKNGILYVATGVGSDAEMGERIRRHRESRPAHWSTLEEPLELGERVAERLTGDHSYGGVPGGVLIDSVDVWVANLLLENEQETKEEAEVRVGATAQKLLDAIQGSSSSSFVLVSSEVGQSLVPPEPLGRRFQDIMGLVNQRMAAAADQVYMVVAGIPNMIKPSGVNPLGGE